MKGRKTYTSSSIFLLIFATIFFSPLPVLADTIGSIQTTTVGSSFDLSINISSVSDLYAFQFDIGFDPLIFSATSVTEGAFLPSGGSTSFLAGFIDNTAGSITSVADFLEGPILGVNGGGTLVDVIFQAAGVGTSSINLSSLILLDSLGSDIASYSITSTVSSVPEPTSIFLFGLGLVSLVGLRKRSRQ